MIRRRPVLSVLLLLLAALAVWIWQNRVDLASFPPIVGAYSAKEYCSCRYVVGNPADYCATYVRQWLPLSDFHDDEANKRVTARGLLSTQSAAWISPREGCRLQAE
ncbi:amidase [Pseudomonas sp. LRF_L74]|uniref:amidase n=1 Tax=Pseudomonas sp. LRF_L74 TaxID=3369422 RepID=UPI003F5DACDC